MRSPVNKATPALLVAALLTTGCSVRQQVAQSMVPLEQEQIEELASFRCVTEQAAVQLRSALDTGDDAYPRGAMLYQATRDAFNPVIQDLARDVRRGTSIDADAYWARVEGAQDEQTAFLTFVESEAAGFGFVGLETLAAIAMPYAKRMFRSFVDRKVRDFAAGYLETELLLPPIAEVSEACVEEAN